MEKQSTPLSDIEEMIKNLKNEKVTMQPHFYGIISLAQWQELIKKESEGGPA